MKVFKALVIVQAAYTLITAIWPLVSIESFMQVTGYKTDVWLVKTVGALLIPIAISLGSFLYFGRDKRPAFLLGSMTAIAFACIDFYYVLKNQIPEIYLADGILELIFLSGWVYLAVKGLLMTDHSS